MKKPFSTRYSGREQCNTESRILLLAQRYWHSSKRNRVFDMKTTLLNTFPHISIPHHILVDSKALFDIITTLHAFRESRLGKTVTLIIDASEAGKVDTVTWIPGLLNIADALTKRSLNHSRKTNKMFTDGHCSIDISKGMTHHSATWY